MEHCCHTRTAPPLLVNTNLAALTSEVHDVYITTKVSNLHECFYDVQIKYKMNPF